MDAARGQARREAGTAPSTSEAPGRGKSAYLRFPKRFYAAAHKVRHFRDLADCCWKLAFTGEISPHLKFTPTCNSAYLSELCAVWWRAVWGTSRAISGNEKTKGKSKEF